LLDNSSVIDIFDTGQTCDSFDLRLRENIQGLAICDNLSAFVYQDPSTQRDRLSLPEQYRRKPSVAPRFLRQYSKNSHAACGAVVTNE